VGKPVVVVTLVGEAQGELEGFLRDELSALDVAVETQRAAALDLRAVIEPRAGEAQPLCRIWIDLSARASVRLFIVDDASGRILERRFERQPEHAEVARERAIQIVASSVEAILSGRAVGRPSAELREELQREIQVLDARGLRQEPAPAPPPEPAAPPRAETTPTTPAPRSEPAVLTVDVGWRVQGYASNLPVRSGPELSAWLAPWRDPTSARFSFGLTGWFVLPASVEEHRLRAEVTELSFFALAALEPRTESSRRLRVALGPGAVSSWAAARGAPELELETQGRFDVAAAVRAQMSYRWQLHDDLAMALHVAADTSLYRVRYVYLTDTGSESVLEPWLVSPSAAFTLAVR
jgi:hypothetical protein